MPVDSEHVDVMTIVVVEVTVTGLQVEDASVDVLVPLVGRLAGQLYSCLSSRTFPWALRHS